MKNRAATNRRPNGCKCDKATWDVVVGPLCKSGFRYRKDRNPEFCANCDHGINCHPPAREKE